MRRLLTVLLVAAGTATGFLWWLHDGDLGRAVEPLMGEWDADGMAREAAPEPARVDDPRDEAAGEDAPEEGAPAEEAPEEDAPAP